MSTATTSIAAGAFAAMLGGQVLSGYVSPQPDQPLPPGSERSSPSPILQAESLAPAQSTVASVGSVTIDGAIVMGPPSGASVGGWTEIGRTPVVSPDGPSLSELRDLTVVLDRVIALGTIEETPEGPSRQLVLHSTDALSWLPVSVPGTDPIVTALAATPDGVLAGGSVVDQGERRGNLWTSPDGFTWTSEPAPPFSEVAEIVSGDGPRVLTSTGRRPRIWVNVADNDWTTSRRVNDFSIARGPGGFLMWRGGGQDETVPTRVLHSADARDFQAIQLPSALTEGDDALAGVSIFALDDRWVLVPSEVKLPDLIYTSADGLTWEEAPRPTRMIEPVRWIANIGAEAQAFGHATPEEADPSELVPTPSAMWAWQLGETSPDAAVLDPEGDEVIDAPVAFGDGYVAVGRTGGQDPQITVWRYEPSAAG